MSDEEYWSEKLKQLNKLRQEPINKQSEPAGKENLSPAPEQKLPPLPEEGQKSPAPEQKLPPLPKEGEKFPASKPAPITVIEPAKKLEKIVNSFLPHGDYISSPDYHQYLDATTIPLNQDYLVHPIIEQFSPLKAKKTKELLDESIYLQNTIFEKLKKARMENNPEVVSSIINDAARLQDINNSIINQDLHKNTYVSGEVGERKYPNTMLTPSEVQEIKSSIKSGDWDKGLTIAKSSFSPFTARTRLHQVIGNIVVNDLGVVPKTANFNNIEDHYDSIKNLFNDPLIKNIPIIKEDFGPNSNSTATFGFGNPEKYPFGVIKLNTRYFKNNSSLEKLIGTIIHELQHGRDYLKNFEIRNSPETLFKKLVTINSPVEMAQGLRPSFSKEGISIFSPHHKEGVAEPLTIKALLNNKKLGLLPLAATLAATAYSTGSKASEGDYEGAAKDIAENVADIGSMGLYPGIKKIGAGGKNILKNIMTADRSGEPFEWSDYDQKDMDEMKEGLIDTAHAASYFTPAAPYVAAADTGYMLGQGVGLLKNLYQDYKNNQSIFDKEDQEKEEALKRAQEEWEARQKRIIDTNEVGGITKANKIRRSIEAKK